MRGDSLRDFYAKALALAGLGALASIGALVDYWPGGVELPRMTGTIARAGVPPAPGSTTALPIINVSLSQPAVRPRLRVTPASTVTEGAVLLNLPEAPLAAPGAPLAKPEADSDVMPVLNAVDLGAPASYVSVPLPAAVDFEERVSVLATLPSTPGPVASSSDGITGMFRKTGSSIATVGVKTGSTIVGAFRAVGGAFRKIL